MDTLSGDYVTDAAAPVVNGADLRTIQVLLGHADIQTTALSLRVSTKRMQAVASPFDALTLKALTDTEGKDQK